jgi:O-antigen ligase
VAGIIFSSLLSIVIAPDFIPAVGIARAYFWEPILIFYILVDLQKSEPRLSLKKTVLLSLFGAGAWVAVLGFVQYLLGWGIVTAHQADRAHGVFNNGNALALFLGPLLVMLLATLSLHRSHQLSHGVFRVHKPLLLALSTWLLVVFAFTKSLGGSLAIGAVFFLLLILRLNEKIRIDAISLKNVFRLVLWSSVIVSVLLLLIAPRVAPETDNPWVRPGGTGQVRLCLWEGTANVLRDNWLLGVGLSGFKEQYSSYYVTCDAEPVEYPHNLVMTVWAELGLLGLLSFVYLLYKASRVVDEAFQVLALLGLLYLLLHGLVDVPYFKNDLAVQFWLLLFWGNTLVSPKRNL